MRIYCYIFRSEYILYIFAKRFLKNELNKKLIKVALTIAYIIQ